MEKILVSILTPTHNRGGVINRLYQSLLAQTNHNIEWIILDDGSTDNTKEIVGIMIKECKLFPIRYYYQENAGKYVALNKLYDIARGEYCFPIDDDDELLPNAVEDGIKLWENIDNPERYWCVCGRCIDNKSRLMVGSPFLQNINNAENGKKRKLLKKASGEKCGIQKVDIVRKYKFPTIENCNFVPEHFLWKLIDSDYKQYYTNTIFRVYHQFEGECLSNRKKSQKRYLSDFYCYKEFLKWPHVNKPFKERLKNIYKLIVAANYTNRLNLMARDESAFNSILIVLLTPCVLIVNKFLKK